MYEIIPNHFAMKYWDSTLQKPIQLHAISYNRCNFRCGYCNFSNRVFKLHDYNNDEFRNIIKKLKQENAYFKFTGGEPTLNPELLEHLRIVKEIGGISFLDTNGSLPGVIKKLCEENLIAVIGLSLKGVDKQSALKTARIVNSKLVWENVFQSLEIACSYRKKVIVTIVMYKDVELDNIKKMAALLDKYDNVILKINNLLPANHQGGRYIKYDEKKLYNYLEAFVNEYGQWKNRVTLVNNPHATSNYESIIFM